MIDLGSATIWSAGTVGVPGDRHFYLQVATEADQYWFHCEKVQVAALATAGLEILDRHGLVGIGVDRPAGFAPPGEVAWRVGQIALEFDEESGLIIISLLPADEDEEAVRFQVTPVQMDAMAREGREAVASGRPPCPRCGLAMDAEGHSCPTTNGDLRAHKP